MAALGDLNPGPVTGLGFCSAMGKGLQNVKSQLEVEGEEPVPVGLPTCEPGDRLWGNAASLLGAVCGRTNRPVLFCPWKGSGGCRQITREAETVAGLGFLADLQG